MQVLSGRGDHCTDRKNGNTIKDNDGNDVEPAYIYMSPNNSWLAPSNDLNNNDVPDYQDLAARADMDKVL